MKAQLITGDICEVQDTGEPTITYKGVNYPIIEDQAGDTYFLCDGVVMYFRIEFINDILSTEDYNFSQLSYTIEKLPHTDDWELSIISTSLSQIEGSEEGVLGEYLYNKREDAEQDILTLTKYTHCEFEQI